MGTYKHEVNYGLSVQQMQGGPNLCHPAIKQQLRLAKSQYKRQLRALRREIETNIAESTTTNNCFKTVFNSKSKLPQPAMINGYSRQAFPVMWRRRKPTSHVI